MLEREIKAALVRMGEPFKDGTRSHIHPDFHLTTRNAYIDAKEKKQRFNPVNWSVDPSLQEHLFIIDDLAVRKLLQFAPRSYTLLLDSSESPSQYYVYSIVDFLCIPKVRVRRPIKRTTPGYKGKWLIDLRDAASFDTLDDALTYIISYDKQFPLIFEGHLDCWGNYRTEQVRTAGKVRTATYWTEDSEAHS